MPKKKTKLDQFADLSWNDLAEWAGSKILSRGKRYQREGRVHDLAVMEDDGLLAWVDGSERYATRVTMGDDGLPVSICTCPYEWACKHAVAVVIEYLERMEADRPIPKARRDDARQELLEDEDWDDEPDDEEAAVSVDMQQEIDLLLKGRTKAQLIALIHEIAREHPEVAQALVDRRQLSSGHTKTLVTRLRREIKEIGNDPGWQDYWRGDGYTPDYAGIRKNLETLLAAGHADEVLALGRELVSTGLRQVEESHDDGETAMEVAFCMPVVVKALDRSSLDAADKLNWALDAVLKDQYEVCEDFAEYLHRPHPKSAWGTLADGLLARLQGMKHPKGSDNFSRSYERDRISDWAVHALDRAGRNAEIFPLCEAEAKKTGNYERLVKRLVAARRYEEAEHWIKEGIRAVKDKWPGVTASLRDELLKIRTRQKNWPAVAAIEVEEFVRRSSRQAFSDCQKAAAKVKAWPKVREALLRYLEKGEPPWQQKGWPLPDSGLEVPKPDRKDRFPKIIDLIGIALLENNPEQVLYWYDRLPKPPYGGYGVDDDEIATAVRNHAPDRAVAIWQRKAERLIAQVKPRAYQEAGKYLRKAAKVMARDGRQADWEGYLQGLRLQHARKIRLMEVLDSLEDKPIIKKTKRPR